MRVKWETEASGCGSFTVVDVDWWSGVRRVGGIDLGTMQLLIEQV